MVPAALRRTAPRPTTIRLVSVRAAADRALTARMPSVPMPRMVDAARVASAVATSPAGKVTAPMTAAFAVSTAHRAGVAARVVRMLPDAGGVGDLADVVGGEPDDGQQGVGLLPDGLGGGCQHAAQLGGRGRADPHHGVGAAGHDLADGRVGDEPAAPDHHQVVSGVLHLAHQVAGDEHRPSLGGEVLDELADPADAVGVQPVDGLVEQHDAGVAQQGGGDPQPLAHPQRVRSGPPSGDPVQADQAEDLLDPGPGDPVAARQGELAEERIPHHRQQGADPGDHRQAARCRSIPTSELTFNAKVTSRGARNSRLVLMNANVYRAMNPHPTRRAAPSSPAVEGRCRWALGELGPEPGDVGRCALPGRCGASSLASASIATPYSVEAPYGEK
jgi:hypothetical protein